MLMNRGGRWREVVRSSGTEKIVGGIAGTWDGARLLGPWLKKGKTGAGREIERKG